MPPQSSPTVPVTIVSSKPLTSAVPPFVSPQTTTPGAVTIVSSKPLAAPMTVAPSFDLASTAAQTGPTQIPQRLNQPPVVPQVEITPGEVPSPLSTPALDHFIALSAGWMSAMQTGNVLADAASNLSGGRLSRETARAFVPFTTSVADSDKARAEVEALKTFQTPSLRAAQQKIGEAKTWGEAWQTLKANPMLATTAVAESLPGMAVGIATGSLVGRMIPALAAKAPWVAGGLGEGFVTGVQNLDQVMQANQGKPLTLKQLAAVSGSALLTAAIGAVGGKVAAKLGFVDLETMLVAAQRNPELRLSVTKAVLFGAAQEGLFEELPQSWQEQIAQNIANGRPMLEGTPGAGVLGGAAGGLTGGGINLAVGGAVKLKPRSSADLEYVRSASDDALLADLAKVTQDDLASPVAMTTVAELTRRGMSGPDLVLRVRELKAQAQAAASAEQESALAAQDAVSTPAAPPVTASGEGNPASGTLTPPPEIAPQNAATEATGEPAWTPPSESAPSAATPLTASPTSSAVTPLVQASRSAEPSAAERVPEASEAAAEKGADVAPTVLAQESPEAYRMAHRPDPKGPRSHDLLEGDYAPRDIYSHPQYYRTGDDKSDAESLGALHRIRNKPDAIVTIYRAGPKNELRSGDWVSLSRTYATQHGQDAIDSTKDMPVHAFKVKASDIRWAGDSINEFGYYPETPPASKLAQSAAASKASFDAKQAAKQTESPEFKRWFGESKVVDEQGKPRVVYHGTSRAGFDTFDTASSDLGSHFSVEPAVGNLFAADHAGKNAVYPVYLKVENPLRMRDLGRWGDREIIAELKKQNLISEKTEDDFYAGKFGPTRTHEQATAATQRLLKSLGYDGIVYLNRREAVVGDETKIPAERWGRLLGVGKANENATKTSDRWSNTATDEEFLREVPEARDAYIVFDPSQVKSAIGNRGTFDASKPSILEQKGGRVDEGRALDALLQALPPSEEPGVGGALEDLLGSVGVELGGDGRSLLWDSGSYRNDFNRSYNSRNLKPITVAKLQALLEADRDSGNNDLNIEKALSAIKSVETKPSTPQPEGKRESFTRAALRRVFGYGREVANKTADVLEAIGLPASRVALQKGGTPASDALPRTEAEAADVFAKSILSQDTGSDVLLQVHNLDAWKAGVRDYLTTVEQHSPRAVDRFVREVESQLRILAAFGPLQIDLLPRSLRDKEGKSLLAPTPKRGEAAGQGGPIRKNQDPMYRITFDATAMCVKRLEAAATASYVQQKIGRALTTSERMALVALFRSVGKQSPCVYCYVEAPRSKSAEFVGSAVSALTGQTKVPPKWKNGKMAPAFKAAQHELQAKGKTADDINVNFTLDIEQAQSEDGLLARKQLPRTFEFLDKVMLSAKANLPKLYEEYEGQILKLNGDLISDLNQYGGMRFFSSSDFQVDHLVDLMQAFWDLTARKMKAHGYTKVPWFVEIFGGTGMKIQTSVFAQRDAQGNIVMDDTQGMDWDIAKAARKKHDHVGTILVATDDGIVQWGLEQDWIDYIIPFHYSSLEKKFYGALEWQDFTSTRTEKPITKGASAKKIRMHEVTGGKAISDAKATRKYLELALQRKVYPVFTSFLFRDYTVPAKTGKESKDVAVRNAATKYAKARWAAMVKAGKIDWSQINPNYFKLRKDYARSDTDFVPVNARGVDVDAAKRALESFFAGNEPAAKVDEELAGALEDMIVAAQVSGVDVGADALTKVKAGVKLVPDYKGVVPPKRTTLESAPVKFHKTAPKKLAQSPSVLFQENPDAANTWYYDNVVEALKSWQNKGTSQQLLAHLGKTKGALEEAEDIGFVAWLKARPNVTKAEAQAYVDQHKVVLEETVLGGEGIHGESWDPEIAILREEGYDIDGDPVDDESLPFLITRAGEQIDDLPIGPDGRIDVDKLELMRRAEWASGDAIHVPDRAVEAFNRIIDKQEQEYRHGGGGLEYEGYQAIKGGTNPREILLKLPNTETVRVEKDDGGSWAVFSTTSGERVWTLPGELSREGAERSAHAWLQSQAKAYTAPHYSGRNAENLLLHTRVWDYTLPDGRKILVAKEIQSDWHQAGRKQGYQGDTDAKIAELDEKIRARMRELPTSQERLNDAEWNGLTGAYNGLVSKRSSLIPQAPFKGHAWKRLALKRLLAYAAEGGYDGIGWTTGAQQVDLYQDAMRKRVDNVAWETDFNGTLTVIAMKDGGEVFRADVVDGKLTKGSRFFEGKTVEDVLGKDIAAKIKANPRMGEVTGEDLTVGGQGMKGFYDRELVNLANDLAKKHGQRVAQISVPTEEVPGAPTGLAKVGIHEKPVPKGVEVNHNGWSIVMTDGTKWGIWSKKADASAAMERLKADPLSLSSPKQIHFLPTPLAMRAEIAAKKQALYQGVPADAQASVEFYDEEGYTKAVIRALNNPDASSALHEIAHVARRFLLNRDVPLEQRLGVDEADIVEAEKFCGVKDGAWTVKAEERFARAFERYMRDGISPSPKLTKVFNAFAKWLTQVYATIKGSPIDIEITPEMRSVFDRLMTRSERLAQKGEAQQQFEERKAQPRNAAPRQTQKRPDHQKRQPEMTLASLAQ